MALHGIDGILTEILHDPLEERGVHLHTDVVIGNAEQHLHLTAGAAVHILHDVLQHLVHGSLDGLGQRANLRETVGNELQTAHVLVHLGQQFIVGILLLEHLHPSHETRHGRSQLVSGLLGESYPHLVLLGTLAGEQGKDGHDDKDEHDA